MKVAEGNTLEERISGATKYAELVSKPLADEFSSVIFSEISSFNRLIIFLSFSLSLGIICICFFKYQV